MADDKEDRRRAFSKALSADTEDLEANHGRTYATDLNVLSTVNAPYKRMISGDELDAAIRDPGEHADWIVHLATMFTDVRPELIFRFVGPRLSDCEQLRQAYFYVKSKTGERNPTFEKAVGIEEGRS